jgi:hypothetical protein
MGTNGRFTKATIGDGVERLQMEILLALQQKGIQINLIALRMQNAMEWIAPLRK